MLDVTFFAGWRGLGRFWAVVFAVVVSAGLVAQFLGPPRRLASLEPAHRRIAEAPVVRAAPTSRGADKTIAEPDPALLERDPDHPDAWLPRVAADGRTPMAVYAATTTSASGRHPRIGLIVADIGLSQSDSMAAIRLLPLGVTLAISPYANPIGPVLSAARQTRREYLLSLPMEPAGYPVNDPDSSHALMTSLPPAENLVRLNWLLSRIAGYVGVTSIVGEMQGDAMMANPDEMTPVLREIAARGLLFIAGPSQPRRLPYVWYRAADIALDQEPADASIIDRRLAELVATAQDKGSALGVVSRPTPVAVDRIAAWAKKLAGLGVILVPASALVSAPTSQEAKQ